MQTVKRWSTNLKDSTNSSVQYVNTTNKLYQHVNTFQSQIHEDDLINYNYTKNPQPPKQTFTATYTCTHTQTKLWAGKRTHKHTCIMLHGCMTCSCVQHVVCICKFAGWLIPDVAACVSSASWIGGGVALVGVRYRCADSARLNEARLWQFA
jgi:hypothetical protein